MAAWSLNELAAPVRARVLDLLVERGAAGAPVLVIEPLARRAAPWWDDWAARATRAGGRADEWRFDDILPRVLAELSDAAGFRRDTLTARSVVLMKDPRA